MASSRRKKRRKISWTPVLLLGFVLALVLGLFYSPITAVRNFRVVGAQPHDQDRIANLARGLTGVPFGRVNVHAFETAVLRGRDIYTAQLSHNVFGSAVLRLQYRQPVATVQGPGFKNLYLDRSGVLFSSPEPYPGKRILMLDRKMTEPILALGQSWPCQLVSDFCIQLDSFPELQDAVVHLDDSGRLTLSKDKFGSVDLGGTDAMDAKLKKLRQLLDEQPDILSRVGKLVLVYPENPTIVPKGQSAQ